MTTAADRVCIVGAGPAGLSVARALSRLRIPYDQYERHTDVGGIWDLENPGTPMYESAHFISSRKLSGFFDHPMPDTFPDYPSHWQILAYTREFAATYGLHEQIRFGTTVTESVHESDRWTVALADGSRHTYRALVCATGTTWSPRMPTIPGQFTRLAHRQRPPTRPHHTAMRSTSTLATTYPRHVRTHSCPGGGRLTDQLEPAPGAWCRRLLVKDGWAFAGLRPVRARGLNWPSKKNRDRRKAATCVEAGVWVTHFGCRKHRSGCRLRQEAGPALLVASQADLVVWIVMTGLANMRVPRDAAFPRPAHGLSVLRSIVPGR